MPKITDPSDEVSKDFTNKVRQVRATPPEKQREIAEKLNLVI